MSQRKDTGLNTNPWPELVDHYIFTILSGIGVFQLLMSFNVYLGLNDEIIYYSPSRKWKYMLVSLLVPVVGPLVMRLKQYINKNEDIHK